MSWTYSGDPTASPKDEVRYLIGDTEPDSQELSDAEINYGIIAVYGSVANAPPIGNLLPAAYAADNLASKYARYADKSVGDLHIAYGNRFKQFQELAQRLRARATNAMIPIYIGGELWSEKKSNYDNPDIIPTAARIDGMDYVVPKSQIATPEDDPSIGP
jgi:hypothetical protein